MCLKSSSHPCEGACLLPLTQPGSLASVQNCMDSRACTARQPGCCTDFYGQESLYSFAVWQLYRILWAANPVQPGSLGSEAFHESRRACTAWQPWPLYNAARGHNAADQTALLDQHGGYGQPGRHTIDGSALIGRTTLIDRSTLIGRSTNFSKRSRNAQACIRYGP
jgi:hypothetical protein